MDAPAPSVSPSDSKSLVAKILLEGLAERLPDDQQAELVPFTQKAATVDGSSELERRRGDECVGWVRAVTEGEHTSALGRLAARVLEDAREVEDAVDAALLRLEAPFASGYLKSEGDIDGGRHAPPFRLSMNRSFAALKTAEKLAEDEGWSGVPWKDLLDRVLSVG